MNPFNCNVIQNGGRYFMYKLFETVPYIFLYIDFTIGADNI